MNIFYVIKLIKKCNDRSCNIKDCFVENYVMHNDITKSPVLAIRFTSYAEAKKFALELKETNDQIKPEYKMELIFSIEQYFS